MFAVSLRRSGGTLRLVLDSHCRLSPGANFAGQPPVQESLLRDFEPRVGFSWDPFQDGKTAIRGGFGMFDVQIFPPNLRSGIGAYPFRQSFNSSKFAAGLVPNPRSRLPGR